MKFVEVIPITHPQHSHPKEMLVAQHRDVKSRLNEFVVLLLRLSFLLDEGCLWHIFCKNECWFLAKLKAPPFCAVSGDDVWFWYETGQISQEMKGVHGAVHHSRVKRHLAFCQIIAWTLQPLPRVDQNSRAQVASARNCCRGIYDSWCFPYACTAVRELSPFTGSCTHRAHTIRKTAYICFESTQNRMVVLRVSPDT